MELVVLIDFPWHRVGSIEPGRTCTALLGLVQLESPLILPTFIRFGIRIQRQLKASAGVLGFRTAGDPLALKFYHLSAWRDAGAIDAFVRAAPHLVAVQKLTGKLGITAFRYWEVEPAALPLETRRELHRLSSPIL